MYSIALSRKRRGDGCLDKEIPMKRSHHETGTRICWEEKARRLVWKWRHDLDQWREKLGPQQDLGSILWSYLEYRHWQDPSNQHSFVQTLSIGPNHVLVVEDFVKYIDEEILEIGRSLEQERDKESATNGFLKKQSSSSWNNRPVINKQNPDYVSLCFGKCNIRIQPDLFSQWDTFLEGQGHHSYHRYACIWVTLHVWKTFYVLFSPQRSFCLGAHNLQLNRLLPLASFLESPEDFSPSLCPQSWKFPFPVSFLSKRVVKSCPGTEIISLKRNSRKRVSLPILVFSPFVHYRQKEFFSHVE